MNDQQLLRYSRHILLPSIDTTGQEKILRSKAVVIGCGGLGNTVIPLLAAAGVGELTIIDHDRVDITNLQRQTHYLEEDIGRFKAEVMAQFIQRQNSQIHITAHIEKITATTLHPLLTGSNVIIDCTDNFITRQAINQAAISSKCPLVFGSALGFEGQLTVFDHRQANSPCYACLFDEQGHYPQTCATSGVFSPLVSLIGSQQAAEALKIILGIGIIATGQLIHFDSLTTRQYSLQYSKNPHCKVCQSS